MLCPLLKPLLDLDESLEQKRSRRLDYPAHIKLSFHRWLPEGFVRLGVDQIGIGVLHSSDNLVVHSPCCLDYSEPMFRVHASEIFQINDVLAEHTDAYIPQAGKLRGTRNRTPTPRIRHRRNS